MDIAISHIQWRPCYRIVASRFPPISLFESVADPADLEAVFAIEAMTNDRLRQEAGELDLVPLEDRVSGPGSTPIMAAFTHLNPAGDRFTDGTYGVFYASKTIETAVAETRHSRTRFLAATDEPPQEIDMRVYAPHSKGREMPRSYHHLGLAEREKIMHMRDAKVPVSHMAVELGRHPATIYRELRRNYF